MIFDFKNPEGVIFHPFRVESDSGINITIIISAFQALEILMCLSWLFIFLSF